ncbi:MAG: hypothetical protein ACMG6E_07750 [Candidatus Roizmanbacteria bacterium]
MAVKYYEEICIFNQQGERFFYDRDFQKAVQIPTAFLRDLQLEILKGMDFELFISEDEYRGYVARIFNSVGLAMPNPAPQQAVLRQTSEGIQAS